MFLSLEILMLMLINVNVRFKSNMISNFVSILSQVQFPIFDLFSINFQLTSILNRV